ncbi:hypothetical protein BV133_2696 [Blastochloris viridis]|uniref:Uncharacterized protein n=1 Tax=Blastochloris viridis TaxID=1079 RepID=A0A182D4B6_BLAVI|nr:hypothetical protein BV133_2696 [Blastochloris viridis]
MTAIKQKPRPHRWARGNGWQSTDIAGREDRCRDGTVGVVGNDAHRIHPHDRARSTRLVRCASRSLAATSYKHAIAFVYNASRLNEREATAGFGDAISESCLPWNTQNASPARRPRSTALGEPWRETSWLSRCHPCPRRARSTIGDAGHALDGSGHRGPEAGRRVDRGGRPCCRSAPCSCRRRPRSVPYRPDRNAPRPSCCMCAPGQNRRGRGRRPSGHPTLRSHRAAGRQHRPVRRCNAGWRRAGARPVAAAPEPHTQHRPRKRQHRRRGGLPTGDGA